MQEASIEEGIESILARDPRYKRDAYLFIRDALDFTKSTMRSSREVLHVTPQELLAGIRAFALTTFGPMAIIVLEEWGISRCEDFGEIVFNMVDAGLLSKTDEDSRDGFRGGYTFEEAFRNPFLPESKLPKGIKTTV